MQSPWAKLALVVLLVASLGLKAQGVAPADQTSPQPNGVALVRALSAIGFSLVEEGGLEGPSWVASRRDCRIGIAAVSPLGWHQSAMAARAGGQGLAYVYAGHVYAEQPVMLTKLGYYWHKLANYFYLVGQPPVFGVVTSPGCAGQSVDAVFIAQLMQ